MSGNREPRERGGHLWLFPLTYAVHVVEEGFAGERFYRWIAHASGRVLGVEQFWIVNGALWVAMVTAILVARRPRQRHWVAAALGALVAINGVGHLVGTIVVGSYSPGLVSGIAMWVPLGVAMLVRSRRALPLRAWASAVATGATCMAAVSMTVLVIGHPL